MKETAQSATNVSVGASTISGTAVASGKLDIINSYAQLIGLSLTVISIILAIVFFCINHRREARRITNENTQLRERIRDEVIQEISEKFNIHLE